MKLLNNFEGIEKSLNKKEMLCIGEIVNTHGVRGELKVMPLVDDVNDLYSYHKVYIDGVFYEVEGIRFHKNFALMKLHGIDDKTVGDRYKGKFLKLPREELKPLDDGRYYVCDLMGLKIIDAELGELGVVNDVIETGSNLVYVTEYNDKPLCIPVLEGVVQEIDIDAGFIKVVLPKGLI